MDRDSTALSGFYASPVGQVARRLILRRLREFWPDLKGQRLLGYGYAIPYLRPFAAESERVAAALPEPLGAVAWPEGWSLSVVVQENALPFPDAMFDRALVVHGLEDAEALRPLMRQLWRVLQPSGKLLIVAANRRSLWAQIERSPFAYGRPFSRAQLDNLLRETLFVAERWESALYWPPLKSRRLLGRGMNWENFGRRVWPALAGVHIVEASKSMYALAPPIAAKRGKQILASASR